MFSQGQLLFGIVFAIVFAIVIFITYKKDAAQNQKYHKGSLWILTHFLAFILGIAAIKFLLGY